MADGDRPQLMNLGKYPVSTLLENINPSAIDEKESIFSDLMFRFSICEIDRKLNNLSDRNDACTIDYFRNYCFWFYPADSNASNDATRKFIYAESIFNDITSLLPYRNCPGRLWKIFPVIGDKHFTFLEGIHDQSYRLGFYDIFVNILSGIIRFQIPMSSEDITNILEKSKYLEIDNGDIGLDVSNIDMSEIKFTFEGIGIFPDGFHDVYEDGCSRVRELLYKEDPEITFFPPARHSLFPNLSLAHVPFGDKILSKFCLFHDRTGDFEWKIYDLAFKPYPFAPALGHENSGVVWNAYQFFIDTPDGLIYSIIRSSIRNLSMNEIEHVCSESNSLVARIHAEINSFADGSDPE